MVKIRLVDKIEKSMVSSSDANSTIGFIAQNLGREKNATICYDGFKVETITGAIYIPLAYVKEITRQLEQGDIVELLPLVDVLDMYNTTDYREVGDDTIVRGMVALFGKKYCIERLNEDSVKFRGFSFSKKWLKKGE